MKLVAQGSTLDLSHPHVMGILNVTPDSFSDGGAHNSLIERNYGRARQLLNDNMDILHAMKDALMKYETIDAPQIDDLMARREVRPPAGWEEPGSSNNSDNNGTPRAPRPVDEPRTPNPGNTMSEQLGDK